MRYQRSNLYFATPDLTIEELDIDALAIEDRLDLIEVLWMSLEKVAGAMAIDAPIAAGLRRWLSAPAPNSNPAMAEPDDDILAGIGARL